MPSSQTKAGKAKAKEEEVGDAEVLRVAKIIEEASAKFPVQVAPYVKKAAPVLATMWKYFLIALPFISQALTKVQEVVAQLPERVMWMIVGFVVCFFGGVFPATIAAFEAARLCGVRVAVVHIGELHEEWQKVRDAKTDDGKPVLDVSDIGSSDFVIRKSQMVLKNVDPEKVNHAMVGLYTGWVGIVAALKIKFAKTVTLGAVIGEMLYKPAAQLEPVLEAAMPEEYRRWVPVTVRWVCKATAITFAWWVQRVFSAFHSAIRGGVIFGEHLVYFLREKGVLKVGPENTYIDEVAGWAIAALGFLFQLYNGFHVPFPFSFVIWPIQIVEAVIVWSVSMA
mmetsp:Transcript_52204/g.148816  ORF Transcript_52204/g.148816 Transcript_52204/m.148816 type:complete len:338 (-) Transcript_52204:172-1185(-)